MMKRLVVALFLLAGSDAMGGAGVAKEVPGGGGSPSWYSVFRGSEAAGSVSYALPDSQGVANSYLKNDGAGALSWQTIGGMAIGGGVTSGTAGSIYFGGTAGALNQDNANLYYDDVLNRLGIGTTSPTEKLDVVGNVKISGAALLETLITSGETYSLPTSYGTDGQFLRSTSGGVMSWATPASPAIGGALTGSTAGRVIFGGTGATFDDDDGLFYDDTNNRLGLGTATPAATIDVDGAGDSFVRTHSNISAEGASYNTLTSGAGLEFGDFFATARYGMFADNSGNFYIVNKAAGTGIGVNSAGSAIAAVFTSSADYGFVASSAVSAAIRLINTAGGGRAYSWNSYQDGKLYLEDQTAAANRIVIDAAVNVGIGTDSPGQLITVDGTIGIREGGASPSFHTIFQGGDQAADVTYTLPTAAPAANGRVLSATTAGVQSWVQAPHTCTRRTNSCVAATGCAVDCSAGEITTGGGCSGLSVAVHDSYPSDGDTWTCNYALSTTITSYAICCEY